MPEVALEERFDRNATAIVVGDWTDELTWTRALRPSARGCHVVAAGLGADRLAAAGLTVVADVSSLSAIIREFHHDQPLAPVLETFDAFRQARTIVDAIRRSIENKRRSNGL